MAEEFNTGFPNSRQIQNLIKGKNTVEVKLTTGDQLFGQVRWQDPQCLCLETSDQSQFQIWKHAIAFIKIS